MPRKLRGPKGLWCPKTENNDATGKFILVAIEIVRNLSCQSHACNKCLTRWTFDTRSKPLTLCPVLTSILASEISCCRIMGRQGATPARNGRKRGPRIGVVHAAVSKCGERRCEFDLRLYSWLMVGVEQIFIHSRNVVVWKKAIR